MKSTAKTIGLVMLITLFSRLLALASNQIYMTFFGVNLYMDIYSYATQLPNIIFNSFGTSLTTVVIPVFAGYIATNEKERAYKFVNNIIGLSMVFTLLLSLISILAAPFIINLTRFRDTGYDFAVMALQIMLPIMIFYALNYIFQGILQSLGRYNMPAFVSVPSSLVVILYVFILGNRFGIKGLIIATFAGLSLQALILVPSIYKTDYRIRPSFDYRSEDIKKAIVLVPPILIGTSSYQLNMLFNTTLAANFKDGASVMTTMQNLILYSVYAFVFSITAVIFPKFTMLVARNDMEGFKQSLLKVLKTIIYFLVPATAGFITVRYQLVDFLYGWRKFTPQNVELASNILGLYSAGVVGLGIKEVIDRAFYALKDTKRPAYNGLVMMVINIAVSLILVSFMGVLGIPLGNSISVLSGLFILMVLIRRKIGPFGIKKLVLSAFKVTAASGIMLVVVIPVATLLKQYDFGHAVLDKGMKLFIPVAAGVFTYYISTYFLKVEESTDVINKVKRRFLKGVR